MFRNRSMRGLGCWLLLAGTIGTIAPTTTTNAEPTADASFEEIISRNLEGLEDIVMGGGQDDSVLGGLLGRQLQSAMFQLNPPVRTCGQVIGTPVPVANARAAVTALVNFVLAGTGLEAAAAAQLTANMQYDIQAHVICSSCVQAMQTNTNAALNLSNTDPNNGFANYCAADKFAHNVTQSALLLVPMDPTTGMPVSGNLKGHMTGKGTQPSQQACPSERWPTDDLMSLLTATNATEALTAINDLYMVFADIVAASSGNIGIVLDNIGYGQSYRTVKGYFLKVHYLQSAAAMWIEAANTVQSLSGGCTVLDNAVSVGGYSEGGFSAFVYGLALEGLGVQVLSAQLGAAPFDYGVQAVATANITRPANLQVLLVTFISLSIATFSSMVPGVPNYNAGQDVGSPEWLNTTNDLRNVRRWWTTEQSYGSLAALVPPGPGPLYSPFFWTQIQDAIAMGTLDPCFNVTPGLNDLVCEGFRQNTVIDQLIATTFDVTICHSRTDTIVPYVHVPNVTLNPRLSLFSLLGQEAVGNHITAGYPCLLAQMVPYSPFFTGVPPYTIVPLDSTQAATCAASSSTPVAMGTMAPVTSAPVAMGTMAPVTSAPVTVAPVLPATPAPVTVAPVLPATPAPVTVAPVTPATPAPVTMAPVTSATPAPVTMAPVTPATPAPVTTAPTPVPATPAPTASDATRFAIPAMGLVLVNVVLVCLF